MTREKKMEELTMTGEKEDVHLEKKEKVSDVLQQGGTRRKPTLPTERSQSPKSALFPVYPGDKESRTHAFPRLSNPPSPPRHSRRSTKP